MVASTLGSALRMRGAIGISRGSDITCSACQLGSSWLISARLLRSCAPQWKVSGADARSNSRMKLTSFARSLSQALDQLDLGRSCLPSQHFAAEDNRRSGSPIFVTSGVFDPRSGCEPAVPEVPSDRACEHPSLVGIFEGAVLASVAFQKRPLWEQRF